MVAHAAGLPLEEVRGVARALARQSRWYRRAYPRPGRLRLIRMAFAQSCCDCVDCVRVTIGRLLAPLVLEQDPLLRARAARLERAARK